MRVTGKDKLGNYWYVESDQPVDVKVCKVCGNPVMIMNSNSEQTVQKVRFIKPLVADRDITVGEVDLNVIKEHLKHYPEICHWCGTPYEEEK